MQFSKGFLTLYLNLMFGVLQKVSGYTSQVTGFLNQPIYLTVEDTMNYSNSVQTIGWKIGSVWIVQYTSPDPPKVFQPFKSRITYFAGNNSLFIHQLSLQDEGHYVITASLTSGAESHSYINLTVLVPVSQPNITVQIEKLPSPTLSMNCTVKNGSDPQFSWIKDNKILVTNQHRMSTDNHRLRITNMTSSDCGIYTCFVKNPVNRVEKQQLISAEHFQECLHPLSWVRVLVLVSTLAVLCVLGFLAVIFTVKRFKGRQEDDVQHEQRKDNMPDVGEESQDAQYSNPLLNNTHGNQEEVNSTYCIIGALPKSPVETEGHRLFHL
ncbi:hepatic and glial cell adhesion molecule-like [Mobula hypostoma]|uniref:hepatic and glial cell adhesion molecule-like n=1 Tax=Mobula hypostoma TaxID=723540 RepID=UPI002FC2FEDC